MNDENRNFINEQEENENNVFEQPENVAESAEEVNQEVYDAEPVVYEAESEEAQPQIEYQEVHQEPVVVGTKKEKKPISPMVVALTSVVMICLVLATAFLFGNKDFANSIVSKSDIYHTSEAGTKKVANSGEGQFVPTGTELSTAEIAAKVGPSVVGIESKAYSVNFFQQQTSKTSTGSGVIVNEKGYIVTNHHVIDGAKELKVILNSGKEYPATIVGFDERSDLAVIKIEEKNLPYATFGDSSQLMVGERAIAIGNPLGTELMGTVTQGIISAVNRTVQVEDKTLTLLQTDAAINSGNSGGALINGYGEVIGINTIKMYATGVEGIGFAIPSNEVKTVLDDIINHGYVRGRLVIGVTGTNITEKMAEYYELPIGFYVSEVREGYGAYLAGVQVGDVIVKCDGKVVATIDDINEIRDSHKVGDFMELVVSRNGKNVALKVKLMEERPEQ